MEVYILYREIEWESNEVLGVFTSKLNAVNAFYSYTRQNNVHLDSDDHVKINYIHYTISKVKLDHTDWPW